MTSLFTGGARQAVADTDVQARAHRKLLFEITLVLLLAAAVRIINSSTWPVWTDEGWSIWAIRSHDFAQIVNTLAQDRHPPAYFLALSAWSSLVGDSRIGLRFLSELIGLLTVAVVFRIGRDWFGQRAAIYAALLLAILTLPIYYSQEVRHYGLLALATTLMAFTLLRYLRRPTPRRLIPYIFATTLMLYTQFLGLAVLGVQMAFALLVWRGSLRHKLYLIGAWGVSGGLYLPWLPTTLVQMGANVSAGGFNNSIGHAGYSLGDFVRLLDSMFDGQLAVLGSVYLLGLASLRRREHLYIALGGLGLYAALFVLSQKIDILVPRTLLFLIPMLALICGIGFQQITATPLRRLLLSLTLILVLVRGDIVQPRIDADQMAQIAAKLVDPGDLIVLEMGWDSFTIQYELKLAGNTAPTFMPWLPRPVNSPTDDVGKITDIHPLLQDHRRVLVLHWTQPPYAIPLLESGDSGYVQALTVDLPIGDQLGINFTDRAVQGILFERLDQQAAPRTFGDTFVLHDAIFPATVTPGESIFADLWWSAAAIPTLDYSAGLYLMNDAQQVVVQHDGQPGDLPTSQWQLNTRYFDRIPLTLPADLPAGTYRLAVSVYWYGDQKPLPVDGQPFASVGQITVTAP
jgi:Dolichyl-phosphate-mannose-protein mannosyltransferase